MGRAQLRQSRTIDIARRPQVMDSLPRIVMDHSVEWSVPKLDEWVPDDDQYGQGGLPASERPSYITYHLAISQSSTMPCNNCLDRSPIALLRMSPNQYPLLHIIHVEFPGSWSRQRIHFRSAIGNVDCNKQERPFCASQMTSTDVGRIKHPVHG